MALDLKTPSPKGSDGKYQAQAMGEIEIKAIEKREKIWFVEIEGEKKKLKCFPKQAMAFAKPLEEGAKAEAEISVEEEDYQGETTICAYLRSFGGKNTRSGGGGGGGKPWQPKSPDEIFANPVSAMTIEAFRLHTKDGVCDHAAALQTAKCIFTAYGEGLRIIAESRPQPKSPEPKSEAAKAPEQPADSDADRKAARAEYARSIFATKEEVDAFKATLAEGQDYGQVMDRAKAEGVTTKDQLLEFAAGGQKKAPASRNEKDSDGGWS